MHKKSPHLDGAYAVFGKVIEGLEYVNKITEPNTDYSDRPLEPQIMKTVTAETFGATYPELNKLKQQTPFFTNRSYIQKHGRD